MKTLTDHLAQYAAYHQDQRNIMTHFIGVPLIVTALAILLSKPGVTLYGLWLSPALIVATAATVFYVTLDLRLGIAIGVFLTLSLWLAKQCTLLPTAQWLAWGLGGLVLGWVIQFIGHYYEGRKPAFVDDVMGLAIGPLFVTAELAFICGLRRPLKNAIEQQLKSTAGIEH